MFSCEVFENFKNTYFKGHLGTALSECLRKISPLVVLENAVLDGKRTIEQQMLFIESMNLMKLVCVIFTLFLSSWNKLSQKYCRHISLGTLAYLAH